MSHAPAAGLQRIGRYRIVRPLSKGGMALVYEARRESLAGVSPRVALKIILPEHASSETFRELFINEARLGASMRHQNLVQIQDFDSEGDTYFLVMEYVEGLTLRRVISATERSGRRLPLSVIAELGRQACDGLQYAHTATDEQGKPLQLVHRDIKPSNLIVSPTGILKVLDFGISKGRLREERKGSVKGTWGYMAPEQAMGLEVGPSSDVFGLAVVLYELASLRPMFSQDQAKDEMRRLLKDDHAARMAATLDSAAYGPLVGVLVRALQRDPAARYESAEAFGRAISALLPDPITARDELVRFAADIEAMDKPRPRAVATDEAPSEPVRRRRPLPPAVGNALSVGVGALVSFTLLLGLGVGTLAMLQDPSRQVVSDGEVPATAMAAAERVDASPVAAEPTPLLAQDEPAGPAGVGAPGERRGVPVARPRNGTRRAPSSSRRARELSAGVVTEAPDAEQHAPLPAVEEPVTIAVIRPKPPPTEAAPTSPVAPPPVPEEPREPGTVMVGSRQAAEVWVDGSFVSQAPVEQLLPAGRHEIVLVAADGRRRSFDVEVEPGGRVKRVWDFDRMEWR